MNYSTVTDLSGLFQSSNSDMIGDIKVEGRKGSSSELSTYASSTETSSTETSSTDISSTDSESESENMGMSMGMDINSSHTLSTQFKPVEKADSYFKERDKRPGSRRWMSLLNRNLAANPGSTHHVF
jgi:hypothetical protein